MRHVALTTPSGWTGQVVAHGHYGRPVLVFPSEGGSAWDFENNGMLDAIRWMVDAGRVKIYCVDSADGQTWSDQSVPLGSGRNVMTSTSGGSSTRCCPGWTTTPPATRPI